MKKQNLPLVFIAIGLLVLIPLLIFILTKFSLFPFSQDTGYVGDTIGGITAPFLNGIAICFLYVTFRQQSIASREQQYLDNFRVIMQLFEQLYSDLNNYRFTSNEGTFLGSEGLAMFVQFIKRFNNNSIRFANDPQVQYQVRYEEFRLSSGGMDIIYLFQSFQIIKRQIAVSELNEVQKQILNDKLTIFFKSKMFFLAALVPLFGDHSDDLITDIKALINSFT